ncbi:MAG: DNA mismatch repair endonuclease MutL, partial [Myxococcota bacterium]
MARVRVLPSELVNQIAAGEVVERPASVVKELVENSLDAGATQIRVAIREGGVASISVADDGAGMTRQDAELAFERHATSKLQTLDDLGHIDTLGFRGEALPSIASVARVRMCTRRPEDALGTELVGEGAGIARVAAIACAEGTALEVAELFGRVPARRK